MKTESPLRNASQWGLLGIPDHQGVLHVGGRLGAAQGPKAFRALKEKLKPRSPLWKTGIDFGDVSPLTSDVAQNLETATQAVAQAHLGCSLLVVVGGGHDHGFSHLKGVFQALQVKKKKIRLGCINIDAHLDMRKPAPEITSGSPFYLALESGVLRGSDLVEFGAQHTCNSPELWEYAQKKKAGVISWEDLRGKNPVALFSKALQKLSKHVDAVVISLDLDALAHVYAPGVSAPQPEGFTPTEVFSMLRIAAKNKKVTSLGIFELNPEHDIGFQTSTLAVQSAYHFVESRFEKKTRR